MSRTSFPPLRQFPFPRVSVSQQHFKPLPVMPLTDAGMRPEETVHADRRVTSLERSIQFLQEQHKETLQKLHAEIEDLRRENKGLEAKQQVMKAPAKGGEAHTGGSMQERALEPRPFQENELSRVLGSPGPDGGGHVKGLLIASLQPLRIRRSLSHRPYAPTLQECEVIIRQLHNANSFQSQEITRAKALLRDIVFSEKMSPERHNLTKAFVLDESDDSFEERKLPKHGRQLFPVKMLEPFPTRLVLPALKRSLGSNMSDRQRKAQGLHRDRLKRTLS